MPWFGWNSFGSPRCGSFAKPGNWPAPPQHGATKDCAHFLSVEDAFEHDVPLAETEVMIRRLAEKLWCASRKESQVARTVVLKLKTSEFKILTRSHTSNSSPSSCEELTGIALALRERVDLGPKQRFRLVGVGLSNFLELETSRNQHSSSNSTFHGGSFDGPASLGIGPGPNKVSSSSCSCNSGPVIARTCDDVVAGAFGSPERQAPP